MITISRCKTNIDKTILQVEMITISKFKTNMDKTILQFEMITISRCKIIIDQNNTSRRDDYNIKIQTNIAYISLYLDIVIISL